MIPLNLKSGVPIFEQIKEQLKRQILLGVWQPGEQLPSVRALASELGINPNTIQRSYSELEREGLTYTVVGKGCFVEDDLKNLQNKKRAEALEKLHGIIPYLIDSGVTKEEALEEMAGLFDTLGKGGETND